MGWDKHVGRVGGLAVALGIGSAIAAAPTVAWADTDDTPSVSAPAGASKTSADKPATKRGFGAKRAATTKTTDDGSADDEAKSVAAPTDTDADPQKNAEAPAKGRLFKPLFTPRAATPRDDDSEPPAAAPLLLTMLATARQHVEERRADRAAAAATSSAVQAGATADAEPADTEIRGVPKGPVVVGSTGTIYQVTTDADGTRVSIIDRDGHVITTSDAFPDAPFGGSTAVARPDGSVVVITSNDRLTRSTLWSVNSQGEVAKIATVTGFPSGGRPQVGADGSLYFSTNIPFIFSPIGNIGYRTVRVSPTNAVRTFASQTSATLAGDGSAYLVSTRFGGRTLYALGPDGKTKTFLLPGRVDGFSDTPILGEDGYVYLPVAVRTLFGGKTTRIYTLRGGDGTMRSVTGLPGSVVVKSDGVYLATFTYSGSTDNGDGTTFIYKITPAAIADPRVIEARLRSLQVTADGTIYAVVRDPASTPVVVISPDGTTRSTVTLPGTAPFPTAANLILGGEDQTDDFGYVTYTTNGSNFLAVLNPDGSVNRTIALPDGTVPGTVFFGPDGAAYQISQVRPLGGGAATGQILLTLSNDTFSPEVRGPVLGSSQADVQFAPDGSGYLILRNDPAPGVQIVGFDSTGLTGVTQALTSPVASAYPIFPAKTLVFGSDGTGYVASRATDDPAVYAFTTTGVTKVLDLDGTPPAFLPVVGPDGTVYVTTGTADGFTVVRTITSV